ncbi:MAG: hypothetical protein KGL59_10900 [Acidobacteriota bacterium]|nr:hypothetical protein [Acidobacteriota bacterium]
MRNIAKAGLCMVVLLLAASGAFSQSNSTQVVFSDTGGTMTLAGNSKATSTPFGFWIWCNGQAASGSNGAYGTACNGNMYFYGLQTRATSIVGYVTPSPTDPGIYTMNVFEGTFAQFMQGKLSPSYTCTLTNTTPGANGPGNAVQVNCMFSNSLGGGTGSSTDTGSLVNITGPSN